MQETKDIFNDFQKYWDELVWEHKHLVEKVDELTGKVNDLYDERLDSINKKT